MKNSIKKAAAVAMAMSMCVPAMAYAEGNSGSLETSFDVYSPALTINVPLKADIKVNPIADSSATDVKKFSVASNSIDVWNASVDADKDVGIPVNLTVKATISSKAEDVITEYNTFTPDITSTKKRINLNLSQAQTAATFKAKDGETLAFEDGKLKFAQFETNAEAVYTSPAQTVPITKYGSLLSVDIGKPTTTDSTSGATFTTDASKVTAAVGSFAVTGTANVSADWKASDVTVAITYDVRASEARGVTTPSITTAPTFNSASPADVSITVPSIGEATVTNVGVHNDGDGLYGDYIWDSKAYTVDYKTTAGSAIIKIPKDDGGFKVLAADEYKTKPQDLVIALSDGRMVVSTLTVN